jgi:hypothetical protein
LRSVNDFKSSLRNCISGATIIDAALWWSYAYGGYGYRYSASAKSPDRGQGYPARRHSTPDVDAGINSAPHLRGQRCGDHEDGDDSTNDRKLAEHI